jgi:high frequency lysogenization protein
MQHTEKERCLALAAIVQAAQLVAGIARQGSANQSAIESSIYSLFQMDADSTEDVYGGTAGVAFGLRRLLTLLGGAQGKDTEITRYAITLMHLERKLAKRQDMEAKIGEGLRIATERLQHFPMLHENILGQLADLYADTISTLQPRIMVQGEPVYLQSTDIVHQIRALLLSGIRAARLWRQCGGNRLQLLLGRKGIARTCQKLLDEMEPTATVH